MLPISAGIMRQSISAGIHRVSGGGPKTVLQKLASVGGLLSYLDCAQNELYAKYAGGNDAVTWTAARKALAPATVIGEDGVLRNVSDSNVPLVYHHYWDNNGLQKLPKPGWGIFNSVTNYCGNGVFNGTGVIGNDWIGNTDYYAYQRSTSGISVIMDSYFARWQRILRNYDGTDPQYTTALRYETADDSFDVSGGNIVVTVSFLAYGALRLSNDWMKFIKIDGRTNDGTFTEGYDQSVGDVTVDANIRRYSFTCTLSNENTRKIRVMIMSQTGTTPPADGDSMQLYISDVQITKTPYVMPSVITYNEVLTRPRDVVTMAIDGNRNAAEETVFVMATPYANINQRDNRFLIDTATKRRRIAYTGFAGLHCYPNVSDSSDCVIKVEPDLPAYKPYVTAMACQHNSPYVELYIDGVSVGSDTVHDYITPAWGVNTYIGCNSDGLEPFNGIIHAVVVFNRALSAAEVAYVTNLLTGAA